MANYQKVRGKMYLLKPRTSQNELKPAETTQNHPRQLQTSRNNPQNSDRPKTSKNFKIGEILAFVFKTLRPNAQIWVFLAKMCQISNFLRKFCLYFILEVLISNMTLFFKIFRPKCLNFDVLGQKVPTF